MDRKFLFAAVAAAMPAAVTLRTMSWLRLGGQAKDCPAVEPLPGEVFEAGVAFAGRIGWG